MFQQGGRAGCGRGGTRAHLLPPARRHHGRRRAAPRPPRGVEGVRHRPRRPRRRRALRPGGRDPRGGALGPARRRGRTAVDAGLARHGPWTGRRPVVRPPSVDRARGGERAGGDPAVTGTPVRSDLRQGKKTLPVLAALAARRAVPRSAGSSPPGPPSTTSPYAGRRLSSKRRAVVRRPCVRRVGISPRRTLSSPAPPWSRAPSRTCGFLSPPWPTARSDLLASGSARAGPEALRPRSHVRAGGPLQATSVLVPASVGRVRGASRCATAPCLRAVGEPGRPRSKELSA